MTEAQMALQLYAGYSEADLAILSEFRNSEAKPEPGFIVDFLGSRIRVSSIWKGARELDGQVLDVPIPSDFHAEAIEWIGLLKAVRSSHGQYVAMELGAGFGPWIVAGALAARRRAINQIRLYAVEGDPQHYRFLRQHFQDNGIEPDQHVLIGAAVGISEGWAAWPIHNEASASESWGDRPIDSNGDYAGRSIVHTQPVQIVAMRDLVLREPIWDLIHIDVQGDEVAICRSCIDELNARTRWLIIGTHSRKIDGDLLELLCSAGWLLEHEKPAKFTFTPNSKTLEAMTTLDGTQVWRNPRFFRPDDPLTSFSQEITSSLTDMRFRLGESCELRIKATNTGTEPWFNASSSFPVNVGYRWLDKQGNVLSIEGNRAPLSRHMVEPGQCCDVSLLVEAPPIPGVHQLWISMVQESVAWFYERGAKPLILSVTVDADP